MRQTLSTGGRPSVRRLPPLDALGGLSAFDTLALTLSPLAFWSLADTSGTVATDISGNGRHAIYFNGPTLGAAPLATGDPFTAVDFDGTDDHAQAPRAAWMDVTNITVCAIVKPDTVNVEHHIITRDDLAASGNRVFQFAITSSAKLRWVPFNTGGTPVVLDGSTSLVAGTKYFLAATFDGTTARIRVNKTQDGSSALSGNLASSAVQPMYIGQTGTAGANRYMDGVMQKLLVFNSRISDGNLDALATAAGF